MKNTIEAIKYGAEVLNVSLGKLFDLIESSKGYEGDNYQRWLANEIIKIAEKDGVGFSQLLVKRFSIISSIMEGGEMTIRPVWLKDFIEYCSDGKIIPINFPQFGEEAEDLDWESGQMDSLAETPFADSIKEILEDEEKHVIVARLSDEACEKGSELVYLAKSWGIPVKTQGAALLYRMVNYVEMSDIDTNNFSFVFLAPGSFLWNPDNADVINHFLKYFTYTGYAVNATDLFELPFGDGRYVFCKCTLRSGSQKDGFYLKTKYVGVDGVIAERPNSLRYSRSSKTLLSVLKNPVNRSYEEWGILNIPYGQVSSCYMSYEKECEDYIVVSKEILKKSIIYFALSQSLGAIGLSTDVLQPITGNPDYDKLFYNSLLLFLFDVNARYDGIGKLDFRDPLFSKMLDDGGVYYSYEAKELYDVCKSITSKSSADTLLAESFQGIRKHLNDSYLNEAYMSALVNLKDYIKTLYRGME